MMKKPKWYLPGNGGTAAALHLYNDAGISACGFYLWKGEKEVKHHMVPIRQRGNDGPTRRRCAYCRKAEKWIMNERDLS